MKVIQVTPAFYPAVSYGGPVESLLGLCRGLVRLGHDVRVLTTNADGANRVVNVNTAGEVEVEGIRVRYCPRVRSHSMAPGLLARLPAYVRWADVVHLTGMYSFPTIPTLLLAQALGKPVVWSPRGALKRWHGSTRLAAKALWEYACRLVGPRRLVLHVTSDDEAGESAARVPRVKIRIIANGVDVRDDVRASPRADRLRLLYLGRLDPIKGLENLIAACARLASEPFPWSLTIAGPGDRRYRAALAAEVERHDLRGRVRLVGEVYDERKWALFRESDVVVLPSFSENFGMTVAEALAAGIPVIASTGTPWGRVEEVGCGLWVDNAPESLAQAVSALSRADLSDMGLRGREWMRREFSWDGRAGQMADLYAELAWGNV